MRMNICRVAGYATRHRKRNTYLTNWRRSCGVVTFSLSFTLREKKRDMCQRFEVCSSWHQISNQAINNNTDRFKIRSSIMNETFKKETHSFMTCRNICLLFQSKTCSRRRPFLWLGEGHFPRQVDLP
jgi:hypothetical protein